MDYITVTVGIAAIAYGLYTLYLRIKSPTSFAKLIAMKAKMGNTAGSLLHFFAYTIVPIVAGCSFIYRGVQGSSLFGD